jgi:hypothetical protein
MLPKNCSSASSPPAEAPMPTIGNFSGAFPGIFLTGEVLGFVFLVTDTMLYFETGSFTIKYHTK